MMTPAVKAGPDAFALIRRFEDCKLAAYPDPKTGGAPWTCGWGATEGITRDTRWTQEQADADLAARIARNVEPLIRRAVGVPLTQSQYDALISILDNVGGGRRDPDGRDGIVTLRTGMPSTLMRLLNAGQYASAADQFLRWISPGTSVERGLRRRRAAERWLFLGHPAAEAIRFGEAVA